MKPAKKDNQEALPDVQSVSSKKVTVEPEKPVKGGFYIVGDQVQDANGQLIPGWSVVNGEAVWNKP